VTITQNYGGNNYAVRLCWTDNSTYEGGYELRKEDWNDGSQLVSVSSLAANTTCRTETLTGNPHHLCVRSIGWDGSSQGWKNITLPTTVDVFWVTIPCNSSLCPNAGDTSEALHFH